MRTTAIVMILTILSAGAVDVSAAQSATEAEATAWKDVASAIPLGTRVKALTASGDRISGTLMRVGDNEVLVKKNTRRPEPPVSIRFSDLERIERDQKNGLNVAKAIGIGLAAGAGALFAMFAIAVQLD